MHIAHCAFKTSALCMFFSFIKQSLTKRNQFNFVLASDFFFFLLEIKNFSDTQSKKYEMKLQKISNINKIGNKILDFNRFFLHTAAVYQIQTNQFSHRKNYC